MSNNKKLIEEAIRMGVANFESTRGAVPDSFALLLAHAPDAFAGYGLIRSSLMKDGALDLKTKELIFTLLDTVIGATEGAKALPQTPSGSVSQSSNSARVSYSASWWPASRPGT